jgi:hypothetical protein
VFAKRTPSADLARWRRAALTTFVLTILLLVLRRSEPTSLLAATVSPPLRFVGAAQRASCHRHETDLWRGSHHQLAMQPATESTVLGDFRRATFNNDGVTSTFFRKGSRFCVRTDGPDGHLHDYEIS